jgi:hypothetical protein
MYSPFYRADGELFTATLAQEITTSPPVGTYEIYTFSDAASAPLMTGLEIQVDKEVMRIMAVSGSKVRVYRGSNGTTPAPHAAGPVKVAGRRPLAIPASGIVPNGYTYQLTTSAPHALTTGHEFTTAGGGWPTVTWSDGKTTGRLDARYPLVTGPNTLVSWIGPASSPSGVKPSKVYRLDPTQCYSEMRYGIGIPPEVTAIITGKYPKAALHVNLNTDACDDFVWTYFRLIRDHFPPGRDVIVEYSNEPWNWAFRGFEYLTNSTSYLAKSRPYPLAYYMQRAAEIRAIGKSVFGEVGRDAEIKLMINVQWDTAAVKEHLDYAAQRGWTVDRVGVAPYLNIDTATGAFNTWDDDQLCDLWCAFLWYGRGTAGRAYNHWMQNHNTIIESYNQKTRNSCRLMAYEGGIEMAMPAGVKYESERGLDLTYNPNWYWMEDTFYRWQQRGGFAHGHVYSLSQYHSPYLWGIYHGPRQKPGYGDGRNGGTDNRLRLATPGKPHSKPRGVNVDLNDSVRGQALIDWTSP